MHVDRHPKHLDDRHSLPTPFDTAGQNRRRDRHPGLAQRRRIDPEGSERLSQAPKTSQKLLPITSRDFVAPSLACDPGLRRKKGAKLRFGRVRERGVPVVGAVRHVYAAVVELSAQCWDTKEAAVLNYGVAREVAGNEEGLVPIVVRGKRDRRARSCRRETPGAVDVLLGVAFDEQEVLVPPRG